MFGVALAWITSRVADWFVMTDELLYERLALSVARLHTPLPRVHDVAIANLNQLYPLVLAPVFATGPVAEDLHRAHVLTRSSSRPPRSPRTCSRYASRGASGRPHSRLG